ncbi:hypothetical protein N656DRAFT_784885 [Canariomyces notabilis]|uniref:Uncharacterized protein n=1 Tax=Canariomyces notabilis TaxID=2074819 RepID=A0AAN6QGP8_9PEZI|nr:hypothetical protein N656DRAFT_784885 [Canariomyces arenarius]
MCYQKGYICDSPLCDEVYKTWIVECYWVKFSNPIRAPGDCRNGLKKEFWRRYRCVYDSHCAYHQRVLCRSPSPYE